MTHKAADHSVNRRRALMGNLDFPAAPPNLKPHFLKNKPEIRKLAYEGSYVRKVSFLKPWVSVSKSKHLNDSTGQAKISGWKQKDLPRYQECQILKRDSNQLHQAPDRTRKRKCESWVKYAQSNGTGVRMGVSVQSHLLKKGEPSTPDRWMDSQ
ncbi:hypothetical protein L484_012374 [Morus notabilis]|uniref:Uncharacterized protein n=1 Tax=Morus notabilis TaxID=981085 RepID=W9RYD8_9ROSA|nr:hypothetical protein L484_012374 [Morus notabilis]